MKYFFVFISCFISMQLFAQPQVAWLAPRIIQVNDKYGIMDENGKTVVLPENDSIIPIYEDYLGFDVKKINPIFFIKKHNKFAFAYQIDMDTTCDPWDFPKEKIRWYTSEFLYDKIQTVGWSAETYNYTYGNGFRSALFIVLKYQLKGKWGLIYFPSRGAKYKRELGSSLYPGYLGVYQLTEPKCDSIGKLHQDGLYDVKIDGRWGLWQVIAVPSNAGYNGGKPIVNKWVNYLYTEFFDMPPEIIGYEYELSNDIYYPYYRFVKKGGKWGVIKINPDTTEMKYIVPCHCDTVVYSRYEERFNNSDIIFYVNNGSKIK